jgi:hypothetical protein
MVLEMEQQMKYKITKTQIKSDDKIMSGKSLSEMAILTGMKTSYLSKVRSGQLVVSEKKYLEMKNKLGY